MGTQQSEGTAPNRELTSWKEIADFLDVSVRTAQRYEQELSLPVRRLGGERGRAVAASASDLQAWKRKNITSVAWWKSPRFLLRYSIAVTAVATVLLGYFTVLVVRSARRGPPHQFHWVGSTVVVTDERGEALWRKTFDEPPVTTADAIWEIQIHKDFDADGRVESLIPYYMQSRDSKGAFLQCFSATGKQLWRIEPKRHVADKQTSYSNTYVLRDYKAFPSPERDGSWWVAAVFVHHYEYPSVLVVVDGHGKQRGEYWHSGHLNRLVTMDLDGDSIHDILAAGISHSRERACVVVFDPRKVDGAEVMPEGHARQLQGFPPATEKATVFFGRSRLNQKTEKFNYATYIGLPSDSLERSFQVYINEFLGGDQGYLIYTIRPDLSLRSVTASVSLERTYSLEALRAGGQPFGPEDVAGLERDYLVVGTAAK